MEVNKRKVLMFRAHYDPMIGPTPKNAFMLSDPNSPIEDAEMTPAGIYVRMKPLKGGQAVEHVVPYANIQSIKLKPQAQEAVEEVKRGPGRPASKVE
jgi:hypothetical protein